MARELTEDLKQYKIAVPEEYNFLVKVIYSMYLYGVKENKPQVIRYAEEMMEYYGYPVGTTDPQTFSWLKYSS